MAKQQTPNGEIKLRVEGPELDFLENRIKELGLSSKEELLRWYIASDMTRIDNEADKTHKGTARSILKHSGKWSGNDAEEIIRLIEESRVEAEF